MRLACLRNNYFSKTGMLKLHVLGRWVLDELVSLWVEMVLDNLTWNQIQNSLGSRRREEQLFPDLGVSGEERSGDGSVEGGL